jgi:hypothetical protein
MFRAQDIARAIQRYRRDHGGVTPPKLESLLEPGPRGQYYLRQLWKDPLVKHGKWGLLYLGPGGQILDPNAPAAPTGLEGGIGQRRAGSIFDQDKEGQRRPGRTGRSDQPGGLPGQPSQAGAQGQAQQPKFRSISGEDPNADSNAAGKQIAGLPIAGVRSMAEDKPFRVYNGQTEYAQWRFTYLDFEVQAATRGRQPGATPSAPNPGRNRSKGKGRLPGASQTR